MLQAINPFQQKVHGLAISLLRKPSAFHLTAKVLAREVKLPSYNNFLYDMSKCLGISVSWIPHLKMKITMINQLLGCVQHRRRPREVPHHTANIRHQLFCSPFLCSFEQVHLTLESLNDSRKPQEVSRTFVKDDLGICMLLPDLSQGIYLYSIISQHLAFMWCLIGKETHYLPMPDPSSYLSTPRYFLGHLFSIRL